MGCLIITQRYNGLMNKNVKKAVALISGGLDSMLAAKVMLEQGVHVEGVNFFTGFCVEGHTHAIRKKDQAKQKRNNALWVAEQLGIKLHIIDIVEEYKDVLLNPKHGYGANINPCLDCKIFMVGKAKQWMAENDFDFIITGEVIGQRPKSQRKITMPIVAKESGADDRLLRPLCAKNLPATLPEREGWVDREALFNFTGRSRKPQMALAKKFQFDDYAQPAGGCCVLTDKNYATKLKDLWQSRGQRDYELDDIILLKIGRHIRPRDNFKLIIAREEGENKYLQGYRRQFEQIEIVSHPGPVILIDGKPDGAEEYYLAARIAARYCKGRDSDNVTVKIYARNNDVVQELTVKPFTADEIASDWYV